jgi:hypothetical protein
MFQSSNIWKRQQQSKTNQTSNIRGMNRMNESDVYIYSLFNDAFQERRLYSVEWKGDK